MFVLIVIVVTILILILLFIILILLFIIIIIIIIIIIVIIVLVTLIIVMILVVCHMLRTQRHHERGETSITCEKNAGEQTCLHSWLLHLVHVPGRRQAIPPTALGK